MVCELCNKIYTSLEVPNTWHKSLLVYINWIILYYLSIYTYYVTEVSFKICGTRLLVIIHTIEIEETNNAYIKGTVMGISHILYSLLDMTGK